MHDKLLFLFQQAFNSADVCGKTLIRQGRNISEREILQGGEKLEKRGDVMIRALWDQQTDAIIDIKVGDVEGDSYRFETMVLLWAW